MLFRPTSSAFVVPAGIGMGIVTLAVLAARDVPDVPLELPLDVELEFVLLSEIAATASDLDVVILWPLPPVIVAVTV